MPKIATPTLAEHRELVWQRLYTAIAELMRERGYDAITLSDVAAAGVSRTAIYNHIRDKETSSSTSPASRPPSTSRR